MTVLKWIFGALIWPIAEPILIKYWQKFSRDIAIDAKIQALKGAKTHDEKLAALKSIVVRK